MRRAAATVLSAALLLVGTALGQLGDDLGFEEPELLRLEGHVGPPSPDDQGTTDLSLGDGLKNEQYRFQLAEMRVMNSGRLPGDILQDIEPYTPNLLLFGPASEVDKLGDAKPQDRVVIVGYRRPGTRDLLVSNIYVNPPAKAAPPAATPG